MKILSAVSMRKFKDKKTIVMGCAGFYKDFLAA